MLVDFFDKKYTKIKGRTKVASAMRLMVRVLANILIPLEFKVINKNLETNKFTEAGNKKLIVSFTSFPKRIGRVWLVIECILRQTIRPSLIVLYLAKAQFPKENDDIPKNLLKYVDKGFLKIYFVEDLRSHKKYYYSFKEFSNDLVVLVDDDILYPSYIIQNLLEGHNKHPDNIICTRGYSVLKNGSKISPYREWKLLKDKTERTKSVFHTSGGGTLYNPAGFLQDVFDKDIFLKYCNHADDVWLNFQAQRSNISTTKVDGYSEILPILNWKDKALKTYNVMDNGNDKQIRNLIDLYKLNEGRMF